MPFSISIALIGVNSLQTWFVCSTVVFVKTTTAAAPVEPMPI
jgi:hypothetical protein